MGQVLFRERRFDEDDRIPTKTQSNIENTSNIGDFTITHTDNDINLKISRSRENSISSDKQQQNNNINNNTSVVITIRMLKMDPPPNNKITSVDNQNRCFCNPTNCQCNNIGRLDTYSTNGGGGDNLTTTTMSSTSPLSPQSSMLSSPHQLQQTTSSLSSIQICDNNLEIINQKLSNLKYQNVHQCTPPQSSSTPQQNQNSFTYSNGSSSSNSSSVNNNHHINLNNLNTTTISDNNNYNLMNNLNYTTTTSTISPPSSSSSPSITSQNVTNNLDKIKNGDGGGNTLVVKSGYTKKSIQNPNMLSANINLMNGTFQPSSPTSSTSSSSSSSSSTNDLKQLRKLSYLNIVGDENLINNNNNNNFGRQMQSGTATNHSGVGGGATSSSSRSMNSSKLNNYEHHKLINIPQVTTNNNTINNNNVVAAFNHLTITSKPTQHSNQTQDYMCMNGGQAAAVAAAAAAKLNIETPGVGYTPMGIGSDGKTLTNVDVLTQSCSPSSKSGPLSVVVPSCEGCRHKSKGKLCKACRNASGSGNSAESGSKSKKSNWTSRFKRTSNKPTVNDLAKGTTTGTTSTEKNQNCCCITSYSSSANELEKSRTENASGSAAQHCNTATTTTSPANTLAISSESGTSGGIVTGILNGSGQMQSNGDVIQPNNQILNRATFYSSHGNAGGNLIVLSMNQGQPLFDFNRFNPEDYPIEDCDERARLQRAVEIFEGVDPPPGFRPRNTIPTPVAANPSNQSLSAINPPSPPAAINPQQWHMVCTPDTSTLQSLLSNSFVLQNNVFLSPEELPRIHSQADYIHCLVPDLQKITSCSFYWGKMDRYEAERLLEGKPEGTFLLRDSAQEEFLFSVSFRKYSRSLHARIEQFNHKFSFDSHDPGVYTASTVTGLLEHYKDPTCVMFFEPMLTIPLNRNFPFSLQQLCRAAIVSNTTYDGINDYTLPQSLKSYLKEYHYKQRVRVRRFDERTPFTQSS